MSSPGRRTPPLRPREEQPPIPAALLPPKKRWAWLSRTQTPAEATAPVPTAPPAAPQIHATPAAAAAASPLAAPAPHVDAPAAASPPPAASKKQLSSPLPPLAGDHKPHAPPPPAADGKPATPPPSKTVRKVVRKVRKVVKKVVPKGTTTSAAAAAARKETTNAAEAAVAVASQLQAVADEEPEPGEFVPDKPATDRNNAVAGSQQSLLGEEAAAEAEAAAAGEPAGEKKLTVSGCKGEERREVGMSGRQKRMREVFVGGLDGDAKEEDVRAVLAAAGEITEVRMIMDPVVATKNRGYCFVRYREAAQARKAIAELGKVKICGKPCRIKALEGNPKVKNAQNPIEYYNHIYYGEKRPLSSLGDNSSYCMNRNPRARNESNASYATSTSSYGVLPHAIGGYSPLYHHGSIIYLPDSNYYGLAEPWGGIPRQASSHKPGQAHGSRH